MSQLLEDMYLSIKFPDAEEEKWLNTFWLLLQESSKWKTNRGDGSPPAGPQWKNMAAVTDIIHGYLKIKEEMLIPITWLFHVIFLLTCGILADRRTRGGKLDWGHWPPGCWHFIFTVNDWWRTWSHGASTISQSFIHKKQLHWFKYGCSTKEAPSSKMLMLHTNVQFSSTGHLYNHQELQFHFSLDTVKINF